mgnify:CR=1 FL=1
MKKRPKSLRFWDEIYPRYHPNSECILHPALVCIFGVNAYTPLISSGLSRTTPMLKFHCQLHHPYFQPMIRTLCHAHSANYCHMFIVCINIIAFPSENVKGGNEKKNRRSRGGSSGNTADVLSRQAVFVRCCLYAIRYTHPNKAKSPLPCNAPCTGLHIYSVKSAENFKAAFANFT